MSKKYQSFDEFYPFYLSQHENRTCRALHYIGSFMGICFLIAAIYTFQFSYLIYALLSGYAFAWIGHFFFEKNRPATFTYPWYSFIGDWKMLKEAIFKR